MARFDFDCVGAHGERAAVTPTLAFTVRIAETTGGGVHALALRCQIRIEPQRRRYTANEADRLVDLFGDPGRWAETLRAVQLATVSTIVPGFTGTTEVDIPVPCGYDLEVAAGRYFSALDEGTVAMLLLFSGTAFLANGSGFSVEQLPWSAESRYAMPVAVWRELIERHFPGAGWLRLRRETLDALGRYKSRHALPTWDSTIAALVTAADDATTGGAMTGDATAGGGR
jgi:hypothetical protein